MEKMPNEMKNITGQPIKSDSWKNGDIFIFHKGMHLF